MRTSSRLARVGVAGATMAVACAALIAVDVAAHRALSLSSDFNVRGYRGPLAGPRQPAEIRVAVLGESTAFGYGVRWSEAMPAQLESALRGRHPAVPRIRVLNLGYNGEGAYSYPFTLRDYADLQPDLVVFYSGYNDLRPGNRRVFRHQSPVFVTTGYLPMLPVLVRAKLDAWRGVDEDAAEDADEADEDGGLPDVRFGPDGAEGLSSLAADSAEASGQAHEWADYCELMRLAVGQAIAQGAGVLVVTQPDLGPRHRAQQRALRATLAAAFPGREVRHVDLSGTVDLEDRRLAWDGMHLTAEGNRRIADALAQAMAPLIVARARGAEAD